MASIPASNSSSDSNVQQALYCSHRIVLSEKYFGRLKDLETDMNKAHIKRLQEDLTRAEYTKTTRTGNMEKSRNNDTKPSRTQKKMSGSKGGNKTDNKKDTTSNPATSSKHEIKIKKAPDGTEVKYLYC